MDGLICWVMALPLPEADTGTLHAIHHLSDDNGVAAPAKANHLAVESEAKLASDQERVRDVPIAIHAPHVLCQPSRLGCSGPGLEFLLIRILELVSPLNDSLRLGQRTHVDAQELQHGRHTEDDIAQAPPRPAREAAREEIALVQQPHRLADASAASAKSHGGHGSTPAKELALPHVLTWQA